MKTKPIAIMQPHARFTLSVIVAFIIIAFCSMMFVKLADDVREQETLTIDKQILMVINDHSTRFLDHFMPIATDIGGLVGIVGLLAVFGTLFVLRKEYRRLVVLLVGVGGAVLLNLILKAVFVRERPDLWVQLIHETGYSFPSGHAMSSSGLGFSLVLSLWTSLWRKWAIAFAVVYVFFVGFSRLYLGVHYPSDILAGWLVSAVWCLAVALVVRSSIGRHVPKK